VFPARHGLCAIQKHCYPEVTFRIGIQLTELCGEWLIPLVLELSEQRLTFRSRQPSHGSLKGACQRVPCVDILDMNVGPSYGLVGRRADGERLLRSLLDRPRSEWVSPKYFAYAYTGLGDFDRAFAQLEKAYDLGSPALMRLKSDPFLDPLKGDPRFARLVQRLNLPWP
jgi:hypothetical protein